MCALLPDFVGSIAKARHMITNSMKRVVLGILQSSRDLVDAWKRKPGVRRDVEVTKAFERLERAVQRLDRIEDARQKTN